MLARPVRLSPIQRTRNPQARENADATQDLSTPALLDELQFAAIDQMCQAIASHIGIEAFGL